MKSGGVLRRATPAPGRRRVGREWLAAALVVIVLCACQSLPGSSPSPRAPQPELIFLGQQILPPGHRYANTTVGGLSGIDYDPATGRYWVISDDRSEFGPARYYEVALDLSHFNKTSMPGHAGVSFEAAHTLKRLNGSVFADAQKDPAHSVDPEAIRVHAPSGRLVWASEGARILRPGEAPVLTDPHVWEMQRDGAFVRAFVIPDKFRASAGNRGVRNNLAFEGLAFTPDFATLFAMTENALLQDGPAASLSASSPSRLLAFDYASGQARGEYVVDIAPIPVAPTKADGFADNGASEILALDDQRLIVMERSYAFDVGNTIKLFVVDLRGATDVSRFDSLAGRVYAPAAKRLLFDFATLGIRIDNIEGITWGPRLQGGQRSLVFVSDDNFNPRQITQFLAFEVRGL
ncbi:MAG: esterase-like activity of phytase family protein [Betaproteobacteria bacterium]